MIETDIALPTEHTLASVERSVEGVCAAAGLQLTLKDTLKQYAGCLHWHYKRSKERGTLEITYWPRKRRAWFKVGRGRKRSLRWRSAKRFSLAATQRGRNGEWMAALVPRLARAIWHGA